VMVPSTLIRRVTLYASERAVSRYLRLIGLYFALRRYQRPPYLESRSMPAREQCPDTCVSLDCTSLCGDISIFRML
jgi:hypothetical protein